MSLKYISILYSQNSQILNCKKKMKKEKIESEKTMNRKYFQF